MIKKILFIVGMIILICVSFYAGRLYQYALYTEIEFEKDYSDIFVDEGEIVDGKVFLNPTGKYTPLAQISFEDRQIIALYMEANNFKLSEGNHKFNRINGTIDKYLKQDFSFEKIQ